MESSPETSTTVTIVTLSATYVCTTQFHVISRQPHTDMEQESDCVVKRVEAKMEVGPHKPPQLVA